MNEGDYRKDDIEVNEAQSNPLLEDFGGEEEYFDEPKPKANFFLVLGCIVVVILGIFVFYNNITLLEVDIRILNKQERLSRTDLVNYLRLNNANYFSIDIDEIKAKMKNYSLARFVSAEKIFPNKLHIEIEERKALALADYSGKLYIFCDDGVLLNSSVISNRKLSGIHVEGLDLQGYRAGVAPIISNKKNANIAVHVLKEIYEQGFSSAVKSIDVSEAMNVKINTKYGYLVNIGSDDMIKVKLYSVRSIIDEMQKMNISEGILEANIPGEAVFRPIK